MKRVKLITDSAGDVNKDLRGKFTRVPLTISVGDREFVDDDNLDLKELLRAMKESPEAPKTASPRHGIISGNLPAKILSL